MLLRLHIRHIVYRIMRADSWCYAKKTEIKHSQANQLDKVAKKEQRAAATLTITTTKDHINFLQCDETMCGECCTRCKYHGMKTQRAASIDLENKIFFN